MSGFGFDGMGISGVSRFRETRIWDGGSALVGLRQCRDNGFSGGIEGDESKVLGEWMGESLVVGEDGLGLRNIFFLPGVISKDQL